MKNTALKLYLTIVCLFSSVLIFADLGDDSDTGDLEGGEPMPINGKLVFLALVGVLFAIYTFRKNRKLA
ncbi:hypothetical protein FNW21_12995 [Flavobacterium restrictum]|uniref:Signal peptidase n=2 Tax=Flavobacterium restrictum TaxID=2594428 RepID=A0A553DWC8_9FLAO|nr:hypothetical protein FNW21_12995 [Flavobacterium restrictum]